MIDDMKAAADRLQGAASRARSGRADARRRGAWPDLFEGFDERECNTIRQAFVASWHEGWEPNRTDVADLTEHARGHLTGEQYMQHTATGSP